MSESDGKPRVGLGVLVLSLVSLLSAGAVATALAVVNACSGVRNQDTLATSIVVFGGVLGGVLAGLTASVIAAIKGTRHRSFILAIPVLLGWLPVALLIIVVSNVDLSCSN